MLGKTLYNVAFAIGGLRSDDFCQDDIYLIWMDKVDIAKLNAALPTAQIREAGICDLDDYIRDRLEDLSM
jgi:hypothetical protein